MQKNTNHKTLLIAILIALLKVSLHAQSPEIWLRADKMGYIPGTWQDISGNNNHAQSPILDWSTFVKRSPETDLNFNPSVNFAEFSDSLTVNYNIANKGYLKVFTVFRGVPDTTGEQYIWRFGDVNKHRIQLSNQKLYNEPKVYKYTGGDISKPIISIVDKYNSNNPNSKQERFYIGSTFEDSLQTRFFKGDIAEVLVYDQEMTFAEHSSIESYLAIKYGVCLYTDYYNSKGERLWTKEENENYTGNVFAIGRSYAFELHQKQSVSAETDLLAVGANRIVKDNQSNLSNLSNGSYMFFADNGAKRNEGLSIEQLEGSLFTASRRWKASAIGENMHRTELAMRINTKELFDSLPGELCLVLDKNKNGEFSEITTVYPDSINKEGYAYFSELKLCSSSSDADYFTFAITSPLELEMEYVAPACKGAYGSADIEITGGAAPYNFELKDSEDKTIRKWASLFANETIDSLLPGEYTLNITDALGNRYGLKTANNLSVKTPDLDIHTIYSFEGSPVELNLCSNSILPIDSCLWSKEGEAISDNCQIQLSEEGTYSVEVSTMGCQLSTQFYILDGTNSDIDTTSSITAQTDGSSILVAPNPTLGKFIAHINLEKKSNVTLLITDVRGNLIEKTELKNIQQSIYSGEIKIPGFYVLTIVSENQILYSKPLIIE